MREERKSKILVIDDEENIRKSLRMILEYEGYSFLEAGDGESGLQRLEEAVGIDVVLLDIRLPGRDGMDILKEIKSRPYSPEVIMISGQGTIQTAVEATKLGAFEFLEKPLHRDRVLLTIRNALNQNKLARENLDLRRKAEKRYELIGSHPLMKKLWKDIQAAAPTNATILVYGESGTGKELIARAIHAMSLRAKEAFVQVNCAAIPEELIESELFGHERGAFTGATERKAGKFEQADRGTIFLDEVGDMSLKTQSKVLRVLEEGEVQKVGSNKIHKVDVRVIAATNKDLKAAIGKGEFRDDLYFRLNVLPLYSPSLREKKEDIPLLVEYFSRLFAQENNFKVKSFSPEAIETMVKYPWKGNVRELRNVVERLLIMIERETIEKRDLPETIRGDHRIYLPEAANVKTLKDFRELAEKDFILAKLEANDWNVSQTAREIDTPRSNLYKKLELYGIKITSGVSESFPPREEDGPGEPLSG
ncbi:MAG: sigma-54-dependent Fis family transcriptional regulator [Candidatus Aminicenantes bacterium]|nr:sigma-54-dependent Fis family transcriptional regulator [Candidatus Aminicenantes bacterium]